MTSCSVFALTVMFRKSQVLYEMRLTSDENFKIAVAVPILNFDRELRMDSRPMDLPE